MGIKYNINSHFFKEWNNEMAYVLGYWYADGSLENAEYIRGKYIRVTSVDLKTIEKIKKWFRSEHPIVVLLPTKLHPGKIRYFLRIGDHILYGDLIRLGLYPNKSLTIIFPKIPKDFLSDFVRGYLDGDGCVFFHSSPGITKKRIVKRLSVIFTSGSFDFLMGLCETLGKKLALS